MINDDLLIKVCRKRGHYTDWPKYVRAMKRRMTEMKLGFPGIGNDHLDLIEYENIKNDDLFIWDVCAESLERNLDDAPLLLRKTGQQTFLIEGIGCGLDSKRDPDRLKFRWMDTIELPALDPHILVFKYVARPDLFSGGASYYYWYKSPRDFRY